MTNAELHGHVRGRRRALVVPTLDAYEIRRLVLVAGCVAVAAVANYAGSALPQRAPVALGSALLGILLVLRRRPTPLERDDDAERAAVPLDERSEAAEQAAKRAPLRRGRGARPELEALAASLATVERQLEAHEKRLTSLSGRQSLLQVEARERFADFDALLREIEARLSDTADQTGQIRAHHIELLRRLNASLADAVGASNLELGDR